MYVLNSTCFRLRILFPHLRVCVLRRAWQTSETRRAALALGANGVWAAPSEGASKPIIEIARVLR